MLAAMKKHGRKMLVALAVLVGAGGSSWAWTILTRPCPAREVFERVREGMIAPKVEGALGSVVQIVAFYEGQRRLPHPSPFQRLRGWLRL